MDAKPYLRGQAQALHMRMLSRFKASCSCNAYDYGVEHRLIGRVNQKRMQLQTPC